MLQFLCRYTSSDDIQTANADKQSQAEQILQQLHEQAELRRREREAVDKCKRKSSDISGKKPLIYNCQLFESCQYCMSIIM